jgi:hypothetical protein
LLDTLEKLWQKVKSKPISELTDMQKLYWRSDRNSSNGK